VFFTVSGTGSETQEVQIMPGQDSGFIIGQRDGISLNGSVRRFVVRQALGGGATAADFYLVHNKQVGVVVASLAGENVVVEIAAAVLTASGTAVSLDTPITAEPAFKSSLLLVCDVTGAGAWTLVGFVEIET
jgi:hypothetical protein